ncbi:hypothetical protein KYT97_12560 [Rhodococcus globerulus]|nr:hypothetical protein KYT97_12560 [Rhodococcus globerulus]RZL26337.1 MAG: hypothetical protein EOP31_07280 [Rhodococcus sp. (in: high G+C Gram-positive bacteria)]
MPPVTGWQYSTRLARDHYIRLDSNDYSVHPSVIKRRIEVTADLARVPVWCRASASPTMFGRGRNILTISDFDHMKAAVALRHNHITAVRPATEPEVQIRSLSDYDAMFLRP